MRKSDRRPPGHYAHLVNKQAQKPQTQTPTTKLVFAPDGRFVGFAATTPQTKEEKDNR
jgi:hypothetical protein